MRLVIETAQSDKKRTKYIDKHDLSAHLSELSFVHKLPPLSWHWRRHGGPPRRGAFGCRFGGLGRVAAGGGGMRSGHDGGGEGRGRRSVNRRGHKRGAVGGWGNEPCRAFRRRFSAVLKVVANLYDKIQMGALDH